MTICVSAIHAIHLYKHIDTYICSTSWLKSSCCCSWISISCKRFRNSVPSPPSYIWIFILLEEKKKPWNEWIIKRININSIFFSFTYNNNIEEIKCLKLFICFSAIKFHFIFFWLCCFIIFILMKKERFFLMRKLIEKIFYGFSFVNKRTNFVLYFNSLTFFNFITSKSFTNLNYLDKNFK